MPPKDPSTLNITLYPAHRRRLQALAEKQSTSAAGVIRALIIAAFAHEINKTPTCPNGSPCLVPHLHAPVTHQNQPPPEVPTA